LGIRHIGVRGAEILADHYPSIDALAEAKLEELQTIYEIGPKVARSINQFFQQDENKMMIQRLRDAGVRMAEDKLLTDSNQRMSGKTFVLTGTLKTMTRDQASETIKKAGGKVSSSVSKNTDYVVVGESPGSKYERAMKLGITILNEDDFILMMKS